MSIRPFAEALPDHARDIRANVAAMLDDPLLADARKYGLLIACAHGTGYRLLVKAVEAEASGRVPDDVAEAARAAAATMAMTNVYHRFVHLASNKAYERMPTRLRRDMLGHPGAGTADYELFALAVSAMNGCGLCIDSHEQALRRHGVPAEEIQAAVRAAAVMKALATVHAIL